MQAPVIAKAAPKPAKPAKPPAPPLNLPELRLLGVLIRGDDAKALLAEVKDGAEETWIARGDKVAD